MPRDRPNRKLEKLGETTGGDSLAFEAFGIGDEDAALKAELGRPGDGFGLRRPDANLVVLRSNIHEAGWVGVYLLSGVIAKDLKCKVTDVDGNEIAVKSRSPRAFKPQAS